MESHAYEKLIAKLNAVAIPFNAEEPDYSDLLEKIGNARFVLIGEATHGSHEFYKTRIEITQQLIKQKGFMAVAIEGDWPDAYRVHRYIQGMSNERDEQQVLDDFKRFPTWMWRNATLPPFIKWLRKHNDATPRTKVGFYGLDLYSLNVSMHAVVNYLNQIDPSAAARAKLRYACFDHLHTDPQTYGYLTFAGLKKSCIKEAIDQLLELQHNAFSYVHKHGIDAKEDYFFATQNARLVKNAENYYRSMFEGDVSSWNVRDQHMTETFNVIADHLENRHNMPAKIIVWAHNSHVGDARATEMAERGEINLGQLVREQHDADTYLIGFSTYQGFVTAASQWGAPAEHKKVMPALDSSYEQLFHQLDYKNFLLDLKQDPELEHLLNLARLQRAIGVIYRPETERLSHYHFARLPYQFDHVIHFDETTAVTPLRE